MENARSFQRSIWQWILLSTGTRLRSEHYSRTNKEVQLHSSSAQTVENREWKRESNRKMSIRPSEGLNRHRLFRSAQQSDHGQKLKGLQHNRSIKHHKLVFRGRPFRRFEGGGLQQTTRYPSVSPKLLSRLYRSQSSASAHNVLQWQQTRSMVKDGRNFLIKKRGFVSLTKTIISLLSGK